MTATALYLPLTVLVYLAARRLHRRLPTMATMPIFVTPVVVIAYLLWRHVSYAGYLAGAHWLLDMLGPVTVAFAVPMYRHRALLRAHAVELGLGVVIGALAAVFSAVGFAALLHLDRQVALSLAPRSVTTPIAIQISQAIGGAPALTSLFVVLTGFMGVPISRLLLRRLPLQSTAARGALFGLGAHAMGVALAMGEHAKTGTIASLVMILTGIFTLVIMPWLLPLLLHLA